MPDDFGQVGPQVASDGAKQRVRLGKAGEVVVTDAHARFYEANYRGRVFHASGAVAGVQITVNNATLAATTGVVSVFNPLGSGVNAVILKWYWGVIADGTNLGKGSFIWAYVQSNSAPTGTAMTVTGGNLGSAGNKVSAFTIGANTFVSNPTLLRPSGLSVMGSAFATSQSLSPALVEYVDGDIIVPPGYNAGIVAVGGASGTGTGDTEISGISWEEVPV